MKPLVLALLATVSVALTATANQSPAPNPDLVISLYEGDVKLSWTAFSPAKEFIVEVATEVKSNGDLDFLEIGRITTATGTNFSFIDNIEKEKGIRYYRVVQVTFSGERVPSEIHTANFQFKDNFVSSISAGKDLNMIDVEISAKEAGEAVFSLSGVMSPLGIEQSFEIKKGYNHFTIPVEPTAELGTYLLEISLNDDTQVVMLKKEVMTEMIVSDE